MTKATELFEYLTAEYTSSVYEDLQLCESNQHDNDATDFNGKEHLNNEDFVCCEQKVIYWDKDGYLIVCLYNQHPNLKYETKEEVKDFLMGNNQSIKSYPYLDYPNSESKRYESKAYNDGLFCWLYLQMVMNLQDFRKNAFVVGGGLGDKNVIINTNAPTDVVNEDLINLKVSFQ